MSTEAKTPSSPNTPLPPEPEIDVALAEPTNGSSPGGDGAAEGDGERAKRPAAAGVRPPAPRRLAPPPRTRTVAGVQPATAPAAPGPAVPPAPAAPPPVARAREATPRPPSVPPPPRAAVAPVPAVHRAAPPVPPQ